MITKLNLSSTPFRNRALPWTVTAIVTLFSVIALVFIAKWTFDTNAKAQAAGRDVAKIAGDYDYEQHGAGYARQRQTDPRIAMVHAARGPRLPSVVLP